MYLKKKILLRQVLTNYQPNGPALTKQLNIEEIYRNTTFFKSMVRRKTVFFFSNK